MHVYSLSVRNRSISPYSTRHAGSQAGEAPVKHFLEQIPASAQSCCTLRANSVPAQLQTYMCIEKPPAGVHSPIITIIANTIIATAAAAATNRQYGCPLSSSYVTTPKYSARAPA